MTKRLNDAMRWLERMSVSLDELAEILAARSQPDRDPLEAYLAGETAPCFDAAPVVVIHTSMTPTRSRAASLGRRALRTARAGALPVLLAGTLSLFGLVRLEPANTLWSQELTLTTNVETGEFACEPVKLAFDAATGLTHPNATTTKLTYTLSGGGTNGPGCLAKDISHLSIDVCFNPEIEEDNPILAETHPGTGTTAWKYDPKNSSTPKLVKWDSKTSAAPLGGKGPFDPLQMVFSITVNDYLTLADLVDGMSRFKAGPTIAETGLVKVPDCDVAAPLAPFAALSVEEEPTIEEPEPEPAPVPEPEEVIEEPRTSSNKGPVSISTTSPTEPRKRVTPVPAPVGDYVAPKK